MGRCPNSPRSFFANRGTHGFRGHMPRGRQARELDRKFVRGEVSGNEYSRLSVTQTPERAMTTSRFQLRGLRIRRTFDPPGVRLRLRDRVPDSAKGKDDQHNDPDGHHRSGLGRRRHQRHFSPPQMRGDLRWRQRVVLDTRARRGAQQLDTRWFRLRHHQQRPVFKPLYLSCVPQWTAHSRRHPDLRRNDAGVILNLTGATTTAFSLVQSPADPPTTGWSTCLAWPSGVDAKRPPPRAAATLTIEQYSSALTHPPAITGATSV